MADRIRVLICDDVAMLRELLRYELEEDDDVVVVGEADNGLDGVRLVEELGPDVVVLDLAMPVIDGLRLAKEIRKNEEIHPEKRPVQMVFYTGKDINSTIERVAAK